MGKLCCCDFGPFAVFQRAIHETLGFANKISLIGKWQVGR